MKELMNCSMYRRWSSKAICLNSRRRYCSLIRKEGSSARSVDHGRTGEQSTRKGGKVSVKRTRWEMKTSASASSCEGGRNKSSILLAYFAKMSINRKLSILICNV